MFSIEVIVVKYATRIMDYSNIKKVKNGYLSKENFVFKSFTMI